jgi:HlyD family secretion protein
VQIDAKIVGTLPHTARPDVEVNADILIQSTPGVMTVSRPAGLTRNKQEVVLYVKASDEQQFHRRTIKIGGWSNTQIYALAGLRLDDQVILTDTSNWSVQTINLQD